MVHLSTPFLYVVIIIIVIIHELSTQECIIIGFLIFICINRNIYLFLFHSSFLQHFGDSLLPKVNILESLLEYIMVIYILSIFIYFNISFISSSFLEHIFTEN